ncbi:kunitz-type protease inhibitor 1-like isoform X1 [Salvelinus fontinalis]|uniref:kunitz-type protease inhibitor 1-like isoform X1 n=1 Tax=Salvelinus fontinalis TaxID=8038 RepID=UPI002485C4DF|nr:kunitz-type protease inhibitor 1-like isoform X1 [Salvelinus fontinalis]
MSCRMTSLQIGLLLGASVCCIIFLGHAEAQAFGEQCLEKFKKGRDDFVLDTNESVKDGATFIASMKVERSNDCIRSCCKDTRCNVAFMEKVSDEGMIKSCFLFDCLYKQTYVCRFVRKKGFQNYIIDSVYASDLATNGFPDEEDHPPVANGGPDRVVQPHESLTLNGIESKDDHEIVTYQWHLVSGNSSAVIEKTKFDDQVIVSKLTSGVYKFQLTVTDSSGKSDQTQITVLVLTPEQSEDHCLVPKKVGPCRGSFPRWHYNAASEKCEEFLFGGCRENLNNYLSLQECTNACDGVSVMSSVGSGRSGPLPAPRGTGTIAAAATVGAVVAVAMAPVVLGVIGFTAGGIAVGSSAASMMSAAAAVNGGGIAAGGLVAALQSAGAAGLSGVATAAVGGVGAAVTGAMEWVAAGAGFSGVAAATTAATADHCLVPKKVGPCRGSFPRWHYNAASEKCEEFLFGGCRENLNNYLSLQECTNACDGVSVMSSVGSGRSGPLPAPREVCGIPCGSGQFTCANGCCLDQGLECDKEQQCSDGSDEENCEYLNDKFRILLQIPVDEQKVRCTEHPKTGHCRDSFTKWYYNPLYEKCFRFNYGGCDGNDNRFDTEDSCMTSCKLVTEKDVFERKESFEYQDTQGHTGIIAIAALLGLAIIILLLVLCYCFMKGRKKQPQRVPINGTQVYTKEDTERLVYNSTTKPI